MTQTCQENTSPSQQSDSLSSQETSPSLQERTKIVISFSSIDQPVSAPDTPELSTGDDMSDQSQDTSGAAADFASKIHLGDNIDHGINDATPPPTQTRSKKRKQKKKQKASNESFIEPPTLKQRSESSSPEKLRPVHYQPNLPLPPRQQIDTSGWDHAATTEPGSKYLASPINLRNDIISGFDSQTDEIQKRLSGLQFDAQVPIFHSHTHPNFSQQIPLFAGNNVPCLGSPFQMGATVSPDKSPTNINVYPNLAPAFPVTNPVHQHEPEPAITLPHYASFFRPRLPSQSDLVVLPSPIPSFNSIEQAMAIQQALTRFHMGVILADEAAREDDWAWFEGLKKLVHDNMPWLKYLGVRAHQIVFYYHGRADFRVGNDVWDAIMAWELQQQKARQRGGSWSNGSGGNVEQEVVASGKQEELEVKEELTQEVFEKKEAEREEIRQNSKDAKKWNNFAKEASRNLVQDDAVPEVGWKFENKGDDKKIIW